MIAYLTQGEHTLLRSDGAALDHQVVAVHLTIVREATLQRNGTVWLVKYQQIETIPSRIGSKKSVRPSASTCID